MLKNVVEINKYKNRDKNSSDKHEEYQYLNLLSDLMEDGTLEEGRNGAVQTGESGVSYALSPLRRW